MPQSAEIVVVGLGAMGSAVLYQLARRGVRAIGIDRYRPPHNFGSSHGETRITRQAVGEGPAYVPLVLRSHEIWRELERQSGESLLDEVGGLYIASGGGGLSHNQPSFVENTMAVARQFGLPHEPLDAAAIRRRYPQFQVPADAVGCLEPRAGLVRPERCVAIQFGLAQQHGAVVRLDETVVALEPSDSGVTVVTGNGGISADRVVVTAGAWLPGLPGAAPGVTLTVRRQVLHWFATIDPAPWQPAACPVFIWLHGPSDEDMVYGIPALDGAARVKLGTERYRAATDPDTVTRDVAASESDDLYRSHIAGRLAGIAPDCVRAEACLYTVTPDFHFLIDHALGSERVLAVSACSGHGFKHSAGLGEAVAQRLTEGRSSVDLSQFAARRFAG